MLLRRVFLRRGLWDSKSINSKVGSFSFHSSSFCSSVRLFHLSAPLKNLSNSQLSESHLNFLGCLSFQYFIAAKSLSLKSFPESILLCLAFTIRIPSRDLSNKETLNQNPAESPREMQSSMTFRRKVLSSSPSHLSLSKTLKARRSREANLPAGVN